MSLIAKSGIESINVINIESISFSFTLTHTTLASYIFTLCIKDVNDNVVTISRPSPIFFKFRWYLLYNLIKKILIYGQADEHAVNSDRSELQILFIDLIYCTMQINEQMLYRVLRTYFENFLTENHNCFQNWYLTICDFTWHASLNRKNRIPALYNFQYQLFFISIHCAPF